MLDGLIVICYKVLFTDVACYDKHESFECYNRRAERADKRTDLG